jgi:hypothetical protein
MSTMGIQTISKLNQLQRTLPEGLPVDSHWLQQQGYSRQLISKYVRSGWLEAPTRGVYRRHTTLQLESWEPVIISMQKLLDLPISVGGRTALELHGIVHYLTMTDRAEVYLFGPKSALPAWATRLPLRQSLIYHSTQLFASKTDLSARAESHAWAHFADYKWGNLEWSLQISTPERAVLELLNEIPSHETFHQVDVLMEGLSGLRPRYLNNLLQDCTNVKVKRLFMWFAERHNHAWFKEIESGRIDLGAGKRMVVRGGKLDTKYLITVPEELVSHDQ